MGIQSCSYLCNTSWLRNIKPRHFESIQVCVHNKSSADNNAKCLGDSWAIYKHVLTGNWHFPTKLGSTKKVFDFHGPVVRHYMYCVKSAVIQHSSAIYCVQRLLHMHRYTPCYTHRYIPCYTHRYTPCYTHCYTPCYTHSYIQRTAALFCIVLQAAIVLTTAQLGLPTFAHTVVRERNTPNVVIQT